MSTETPTEVKEANIPLEEAGSSSSSTLSAEEVQSKFEKAKKLYNEDKYSEAAELFADVLESQYVILILYYYLLEYYFITHFIIIIHLI